MSRTLTILIAILVLIGSFLMIRYAKDSYKILPFDEKNPLNSPNNFQDWKEFSESDGKFQALFPVLPQHAADKIADPITKEPRMYDMYASASDSGAGFIISAITFPEKIDQKDVNDVLRSAVNDVLARNKENTLNMGKVEKFNDLDSLDFTIENKEVKVAGKVILHDNMLYILSMADKASDFDHNKLKFFINSFKILDKAPPLPVRKKLPKNEFLKQDLNKKLPLQKE